MNDSSENNRQSSDITLKNNKKFFFNMKNIILDEEYSSEKKDITNNLTNSKKIKSSKNKFFTDYNSDLKCTCFRTQCDNNYCECFRMGRYCINCNCNNCLNTPPENISCDKKDNNNSNSLNNKKKKVSCNCSKTGCKQKYCECFKIGQKCTELCQCIKCQNSNLPKEFGKNKLNKVCSANSIYIIQNKIKVLQDIKTTDKKEFLNKKRKKEKVGVKRYNNSKNVDISVKDKTSNNESSKAHSNKGELPEQSKSKGFARFKLENFNNVQKCKSNKYKKLFTTK